MRWSLCLLGRATPLRLHSRRLPPLCVTYFPSNARHYSLQNAPSPKPHYTTTPIFYVNADPHIGHLHSLVLADVFSRWAQWRNKGWSEPPSDDKFDSTPTTRAIFATGTDEHGIKIQQRAEILKEEPRDLCDRVSQRFRLLAEKAKASHTRFIRTTDEDHVEAVKHFWNELEKRGYIYKGTHEGWYAVSDEAFYTSTQIKPQEEGSEIMVSIETGSVVEWSSEETYKFKLSEFKDRLLQWLEANPRAVVPASVKDQLVAEIQRGLKDLSVSRPRSRLHWGIPVPSDSNHTIYVWLDALTNYLTVSGYPWKGIEGMGCWPTDVQVIGKDILRFHAIYFPAFLMALDLPLPKHTVTHGFWSMEGVKMSKSRGNVVDPFKMIDEIGVEDMRWALCRMGGNNEVDSVWSEEVLHMYHGKYLSNQWGNYFSRMLSPHVIANIFADSTESTVEISRPELSQEDISLNQAIESLAPTVGEHMNDFHIKRALEHIGNVLSESAVHFHLQAPWIPGGDRQMILRTLYYAREAFRISALLATPVLPDKMKQLLDIIDPDGGREWSDALTLRDSFKISRRKGKIAPLFPKLKHSIIKTM